MRSLTVLWASFTAPATPSFLANTLARHFSIRRVDGNRDLEAQVRAVEPVVACFDFDRPSPVGLDILRHFRHSHPFIPIIMLAETDGLALWALRARVWNYFVKPVLVSDLRIDIGKLARFRAANDAPLARQILYPHSAKTRECVAPQCRHVHPTVSHRGEAIIAKAEAYVQMHLGDDIKAADVARRCCVSYWHFCRTFKRSCGVTFTDFVQSARIRRAVALFKQPHATITRVSCEVGFKDVGYFARVFKHHMGMSPSVFLNSLQHNRSDRRLGADRRRQANVPPGRREPRVPERKGNPIAPGAQPSL